jgi:hypothetical protein
MPIGLREFGSRIGSKRRASAKDLVSIALTIAQAAEPRKKYPGLTLPICPPSPTAPFDQASVTESSVVLPPETGSGYASSGYLLDASLPKMLSANENGPRDTRR